MIQCEIGREHIWRILQARIIFQGTHPLENGGVKEPSNIHVLGIKERCELFSNV